MRKFYVFLIVTIFVFMVSSVSPAADLKIKVRDSSTGETVSDYEKTYTPEEQEAMKQNEIMKRQEIMRQEKINQEMKRSEQIKQQGTKNPLKDSKVVDLEKRRLQDALQNCQSIPLIPKSSTTAATRNINPRNDCIDRTNKRIKELNDDPEYYFYRKGEREKAQALQPKADTDTRSRSDFLPKVGKYRWEVE